MKIRLPVVVACVVVPVCLVPIVYSIAAVIRIMFGLEQEAWAEERVTAATFVSCIGLLLGTVSVIWAVESRKMATP